MTQIKTPKKLIEVALPLDAINASCAAEKQPFIKRHPRSMHIWWARRPHAAARAVIFAQMVNDPGGQRGYFSGMTKAQAQAKREELFKIIEDLVQWENTNNEEVLARARAAIWESWRETCRLNKAHPDAANLFNPEVLPGFHDPFAGGGALPLEAQRLGLESYASDLNPVAVTINKALIEIPPRFIGQAPIGPETIATGKKNATKDVFEDWSGTKGLAEDVRRYGAWMSAEAKKRIGHLYPKVAITEAMAAEREDLKPLVGEELTVIAWLWARTVKSPNPAFSHVDVPLVSTYVLSSKKGKEAYVEPLIEGDAYRFIVRCGEPPEWAKEGNVSRKGAVCLFSKTSIDFKYLRSEAKSGRFGSKLMAIVAEGKKGRIYISPSEDHEALANSIAAERFTETEISHWPGRTNVVEYGMTKFMDLFTSRQLVALSTFSDLVQETIAKVQQDAYGTSLTDDGITLEKGGHGALAYAQAVGVYLGMASSRWCDMSNSLAGWNNTNQNVRALFSRQAIPMNWDFVELSPFSKMGSWFSAVESLVEAFPSLAPSTPGHSVQSDAQNQTISASKVISTDPPYYDNIGYADLSDFFYVWLRRNLRQVFPELYASIAVPKHEELVATPYRHGGKDNAELFFLEGMTDAMHNLAEQAHPAFPVTIYYAFKQAETKGETGTSSTGWETFLAAVLKAGFAITGTWPMRTERDARAIGIGANALASSVVLVCRQRAADAVTISRREFIRELNTALPEALLDMTRGGENSPVAPVDLSQAIIGPGMAIFSQYAAVLEADGTPMSVKTALQLINRFLAEDDFDHDTQFCLAWFEQLGWATGKYGDADVLARAKGTSVGGLVEAGVVESASGELRLLRWAELATDWSPEGDVRTPVWEALHQLIRSLNQEGESVAGGLLARMPARAEAVRALAYRLYTLCERQGWAEEARAYNELIGSWSGIEQASQEVGHVGLTPDLYE